MAGIVEEMGVNVEGDRDPGVAEDATDLGDVEAEVDDQVTGEGMTQVVEAQRRPSVSVQLRGIGSATQHPLRDVAVALRGSASGGEDPVVWRGKGCVLLVDGEQAGELLDQRHLANRGGRLRRRPPSRFAAMGAGELRADPNQASGKVDVLPNQPEELGDPQAAEEGGGDQ